MPAAPEDQHRQYRVHVGGDAAGPVVAGEHNHVEVHGTAAPSPDGPPAAGARQSNAAHEHGTVYAVQHGDMHIHQHRHPDEHASRDDGGDAGRDDRRDRDG